MNGFLRQATAAQVRTIGPFIDSGDFVSLENALTIANTDVLLKKNGAASGAKNSGGATADSAGGLYHLTWDATDTSAVGELYGSVKVAGALVVFFAYVVLEEAVYDALFLAAAPGYLQPTTAGRTLDVSAGGEAGIDWANVGSPTTAVNLSATNIDPDQIVASVAGAVGSVTGAVGSVTGNVGGNVAGSVGSVTGAVASVTGAVGSVTGNVGGNVVGSVASVTAGVTVTTNNDKTGYGLSAAAVQAIWDALTAALTAVGSVGKLLVDNINATISSRFPTASYTTPPTATENADALLDRAAAIETGLTPRQSLRLIAAASAGKISGAATSTATIRNAVADSKARITATVDSDGNRTAVTTDVT